MSVLICKYFIFNTFVYCACFFEVCVSFFFYKRRSHGPFFLHFYAGMGGAKGRKGSSKKEVKEVKEKKKVLTGSASRPLGVHGSDVQAQSSGVINADGSDNEWDEDWYNYLHSEEFARREDEE